LAVQAGNESAGSDGVGIFEGLSVGFAEVCFKRIIPDWGVAFAEQGENCSGLVIGNRVEDKGIHCSLFSRVYEHQRVQTGQIILLCAFDRSLEVYPLWIAFVQVLDGSASNIAQFTKKALHCYIQLVGRREELLRLADGLCMSDQL